MKTNIAFNSYDVLVVGAGPAGATIARRYAETNKKVLVIDKRNHIAGNLFDRKNEKGLTYHVYGPHIFHTSNKEVIEYVKKFAKFNEYRWKVNVRIDDKEVPLPINFSSIEKLFDKEKAEKIISSLKKEFGETTKTFIHDLLESKNKTVKDFGKFVFKNVFENYTSKMWGIKPEEIDRAVLKRVGILLSYDDGYFNDDFQGVPKKGYTPMLKKMLKHKNIDVILNIDFKAIGKIEQKKFVIDNQEFNGIVVYTGPLDELFDYKYGVLSYRSLVFEFENHNVENYQSRGCVNYPAHPTMTRITEYKKVSLEKNKKWTVIGKEYPGNYDPSTKWNERYYPIPQEENTNNYNKYAKLAKTIPNLMINGRLAEFKYKDMWLTFKDALDIELK